MDLILRFADRKSSASTLLRRCHRLHEKAVGEERSAKIFHHNPTRNHPKQLIPNSANYEARLTDRSRLHTPCAARAHDINMQQSANRNFNFRFAKRRDGSPDRHNFRVASNPVSRKFAYEFRFAKPPCSLIADSLAQNKPVVSSRHHNKELKRDPKTTRQTAATSEGKTELECNRQSFSPCQ